MAEVDFQQAGYPLLTAPQVRWRIGASVVLGTALVAVCAHIAVPLGFTPVPLTMQTFAVLLLGLVLGPRAAFSCLALYLLEGAAGLPVFSPQGPGGITQLLGPSGGYLLSYPFAAALASMLYRRTQGRLTTALVSAGAASLLMLATGAAWLGILTHAKFSPLFHQAIAPFLPGDGIKVVAAAGCASLLATFRRSRQNQTLSGTPRL